MTDLDYADALAAYDAAVADHPEVERKGAKMPYTAINGNMFSFLDPTGMLCLRLPADRRAAFQEEHGTGPVMQYGAVMKEYAAVPAAIVSDRRALSALFSESLAYAKTLKPKPTTRKKKS